jgi:peroxidase
LRLSPEQAGLGLQAIDTRLSLLGDTCPILPACVPIKYRSFDGTCNNLRQPSWGSALSPLERLAPPEYDDGTLVNCLYVCTNYIAIYFSGIWEPKIRKFGQELPSVRVVRSVLVTDENHPKVDMTHMLMQWGQFLDHDMIHVPVFRTGKF